jgi:hypothetical protein
VWVWDRWGALYVVVTAEERLSVCTANKPRYNFPITLT